MQRLITPCPRRLWTMSKIQSRRIPMVNRGNLNQTGAMAYAQIFGGKRIRLADPLHVALRILAIAARWHS